tara:strand:- start:952 stop:1731 length:780 start_codon:yes stop_codon:yes gene_type:complete
MHKDEKKKKLAEFLEREKIATMQDLKKVASTDVGMTIYRLLKRLSYLTSYSHNGTYYALKNTVKFDSQGLWAFQSVRFSRYGTLLTTLERFVSDSEHGFFAQELEETLGVGVKESLLRLVQMGRISRERISRSYLYCAKNSSVRRRQLAERRAELSDTGIHILFEPDQVSDEVKAAIILFTALLNEQQRRLFAGIEALQFGREAERWIAHLLGIHPQTVAKGKKELLGGDVNFKRIRKEGAGRPRAEKKRQRFIKKSKD